MLKRGRWNRRAVFMGLSVCVVLLTSMYQGWAKASPLSVATAPSLGAAASFAVLGGQTVTNTGPTTINGDLGVYPGTSITGLPSITLVGTVHQTDSVAQQAQDAVTTAYNNLAGQACDTTYGVPTDLGGKNLTPGVYCFASSAQLTGILTLNAQGNPNAVWVFKIGSAITTASGSSVVFVNGGSPCNIFWQVTSSATLGTGSNFVGSILALTSISLNTGASLSGRVLARNGAVTMDTNTISSAGCTAAPTPTATTIPAAPTATTIPAAPTATTSPAAPTASASGPTRRCIGNIRGNKTNGAGQGIAGWTIQLFQANEVVRTAVTDGNGSFDFLGLEMGAYTVREVPQTGWSAQGPTSIDTTLTACDQNLTGYTFVNVSAAATPTLPTSQTSPTPQISPTASPVPPGPTGTRAPATATPASALTPSLPGRLPSTGDPLYLNVIWFAFGGAGTALFGFALLRIRR